MGQATASCERHLPGLLPQTKMTMGTLKALGEERLKAGAPLGRLGDDEDLKGHRAAVRQSMRASTSLASGWRWMGA